MTSQSNYLGNTNSASMAQSQRIIKQLEGENRRLSEELAEIKSVYIQLTKETPQEKFDERRVTFLKSQLIQLERQTLLLNEALGTRMAAVVEAENAFVEISTRCKSYLEQEGRIGEVYMSKEDVNKIINTAESARIKLFKNIENTSTQRLHKPLQYLESFLKPSSASSPPTILDVCSGRIDHLSLKQVARLESRLTQLYKQLQTVNQCLSVQVFPEAFTQNGDLSTASVSSNLSKGSVKNSKSANSTPQLPQANYVRLYGESCQACRQLGEVLPDLLELSILVPAAPLPVLRKCIVKELNVDNVMAKLPAMSKAKSYEARETVQAVLRVLSLIQLKASSQERVYKEELKFHKSVYQTQVEYTEQLFQAIRLGYRSFEEEANELICQPLAEVLRIYDVLQKTASEDALRRFLKVFKNNHIQISEAVSKLQVKEKGEGALSSFAEEFYEKLRTLETECQDQRDDNISKLQEVKLQQEDYWSEIKKTFSVDEEITFDESAPNHSTSKSAERKKRFQIRTQSLDTGRHCAGGSEGNYTERDSARGAHHFPHEREPLPVINNNSVLDDGDNRSNENSPRRGVLSGRAGGNNDSSCSPDRTARSPSRNRQKKKSGDSPIHRNNRNDIENKNEINARNKQEMDNSGYQDENRQVDNRSNDPQIESEELFKATLRSGFDEKGFVFDSIDSSRTGTSQSEYSGLGSRMATSRTDDSECTCGAEHDHHGNHSLTTDNSNHGIDNNKLNNDERSMDKNERSSDKNERSSDKNERSSDKNERSLYQSKLKPPLSHHASPKKLMRGIPQPKLRLKKYNTSRTSDMTASDSDQDTTPRQRRRKQEMMRRTGSVGDNRDCSPGSPGRVGVQRAGSVGREGRGEGVRPGSGGKEASFPVSEGREEGRVRRSGSVPRPKPEWKS